VSFQHNLFYSVAQDCVAIVFLIMFKWNKSCWTSHS